jgi:hypothetical protein
MIDDLVRLTLDNTRSIEAPCSGAVEPQQRFALNASRCAYVWGRCEACLEQLPTRDVGRFSLRPAVS